MVNLSGAWVVLNVCCNIETIYWANASKKLEE